MNKSAKELKEDFVKYADKKINTTLHGNNDMSNLLANKAILGVLTNILGVLVVNMLMLLAFFIIYMWGFKTFVGLFGLLLVMYVLYKLGKRNV